MGEENIDKLIEKSASTDVNVLLTAKEKAKRSLLDDPSPTNLAAFERASKLVESAMETKSNLKDYKAVLEYAQERQRKVGKTKLYDDVNEGKLRRQPDGSFKLRDVDRYLATLPHTGTPDPVHDRAVDRQRRKEEQEIRRIKAVADKEEFDLAVKKGKFIPKDQVHLELAGRAATLASGLKTAFESRSLDIIALVEGNPKKSAALVELLEDMLDEALHEYSREVTFEVFFVEEQDDADKK